MNAFKNAFKIVFSRFSFLWVLLLFYFIAAVILISIGLTTLFNYFDALLTYDFLGEISGIVSQIFNGGFTGLEQTFSGFFAEMSDLFSNVWTYVIFILLSALSRFIFGLADIAIYDNINSYMNSTARLPFGSCFIKRLGKSAVYQLSKMLYALPADIVVYGAVYLASRLFAFPVMAIFTPFLMMIVFIAAYSLRLALFSGWAPRILNSEHGKIFLSFKESAGLFAKNFGRMYGSQVLFLVLAIALNLFFGIFTFGVGLIITGPLTLYYMTVLNCTLYYQNSGLRYYVDSETIINN